MGWKFNPFTGNLDWYDPALGVIDELGDVDTTTDTPEQNEVLKWNGTAWAPAPYNYNFEFSIDSFSDETGALLLIGSGVRKAIGAMSYTASYNNGPPTSAHVTVHEDGQLVETAGNMDAPNYTSGTNSVAVDYPDEKDGFLRFKLWAYHDDTEYTELYPAQIYFRNYIKWGTIETDGTCDSDYITGMTDKDISNDQTRSVSINCVEGEELLFCFPASYASIHAEGYLFNDIICPFTVSTVSYTNENGYTEDYKVCRSDNANLGDSTLTTSTSSAIINSIYYGTSTDASGHTDGEIGALNSLVSNNEHQTVSVDPGASDHVVYAYPTRLGTTAYGIDYEADEDNSFRFDSIGCGMNRETLSVTNENGYSENYYVYTSDIVNMPGSTLILGNDISGVIDRVYYGGSTKTSGYTEGDVEGLDDSEITNDVTQTWDTIDLDAGGYYIFAMPNRHTTPTFYDNDTGFEAAFGEAEIVSVTNASGWTEDYKVFRSENPLGPGDFTLRTE